MWSVLANSIGTLLEYTCSPLPESMEELDMGQTFLDKLTGWLYIGGLMITLWKTRVSFKNAFSVI